ncbi:class I adenylate-forming enzyme family protein [Candidatus Poriferisodalis sp.]|uniref:class I adenylate-forming enzyme family protein n=1 Tax=Candidatus Poriferisodalis sp. TaxID=3101277 RepID=UPI003B02B3DB
MSPEPASNPELDSNRASDWHRHLPAGWSAGDIDLSAGGTLPAVWLDRWSSDPQRPVVWDASEGWVTGAQLLERAQEVAQRLAGVGIVAGDRVLMSGPSSTRLVAAHAALLGIGAVVVPLNGAYRADEVRNVVTDCRPAAALIEDVGSPGEWEQWITSADPTVLTDRFDATELSDGQPSRAERSRRAQFGDPLGEPGASDTYRKFAGPASDLELRRWAHEREGDEPALIGYTSGTTGRPKGAVLSHANLLASVRALELAWRWTSDDVLVLALPLFHMHGLGVGLHGTLTVGARAVLQPTFDPDAVFDAIREHQATMFFGVPTMYSRLVASPRAAELSALRLCVSGSAPMPAELHDAVREASGQHVIERYGMTETVMLVSNPYDEPRRAGTVGFPLPGVEVRLDSSNDSDLAERTGHSAPSLPTDRVGVCGRPDARSDAVSKYSADAVARSAAEILVRGPNVFSGYWERPDDNAASFDNGWFRTGDLGVWDDGYLRIVGRAKELIICGGFNVYPREVEEAIAEHPDVIECAVGGEADPEWGEVVVAYVVADRDFEDDELKDYVGERLAYYKRPRRTYRISALPRNALGKLLRHELTGRGGP